MEALLINKVSQSKLITINLEHYYPSFEYVLLDITPYLFKGLVIVEKELRSQLRNEDWTQYNNKQVLLFCSNKQAMIPSWTFMLFTSYLVKYTQNIYIGSEGEYLSDYYKTVIEQMDIEPYIDQKIIIKGCSQKPVPMSAYAYLTNKLQAHASSIMFGEPCSNVPIFKRN